jgi:hypothetical protein
MAWRRESTSFYTPYTLQLAVHIRDRLCCRKQHVTTETVLEDLGVQFEDSVFVILVLTLEHRVFGACCPQRLTHRPTTEDANGLIPLTWVRFSGRISDRREHFVPTWPPKLNVEHPTVHVLELAFASRFNKVLLVIVLLAFGPGAESDGTTTSRFNRVPPLVIILLTGGSWAEFDVSVDDVVSVIVHYFLHEASLKPAPRVDKVGCERRYLLRNVCNIHRHTAIGAAL